MLGLGDNFTNVVKWDYRTLPNKLYELVKNLGDMKQAGTGYYTDTESEMLTVLAYLNYGEETNITESMKEQIDLAVKVVDETKLEKREAEDRFANFNF